MYLLNKIVGGCLNPLVIGLVLVIVGGLCLWRSWRKTGFGLLIGAVAWLWSTPMMYRWIGGSLESEWPVVKAEDAPVADAIVLLGGGMGSNTNVYPYAEMWNGADRVWHAARLYKAGKAPVVISSGVCERESTLPLLLDFGVPESAILIEDKARNTEENAKFVEKLIKNRVGHIERADEKDTEVHKPKVLLVTSAWHMKRSLMMFAKYAPNVECIPAACDFECIAAGTLEFGDFVPDPGAFECNCRYFHEWLGIVGYSLLRK
jgi:uncharacterized SAM-binding protein YcdF (DUF218 family)